MANLIASVVILVILGMAIGYIVKAKKRGVRCVGCPDAGTCAQKNACASCNSCSGNCSSCHTDIE